LDLGHIFFIYKRKSIKPGPGHQLLIEAKARANQVASGGDVRSKTVPENSPEAIETREVLADMAGSTQARQICRAWLSADPKPQSASVSLR
jgi:hypothetical protein